MLVHAPPLDPGNWTYDVRPMVRTKTVFVHVPKTAGLAIARAVYGSEGGGHRTVREYEEEFGPELLAEMFTFASVRDPAERVASAYRYLKRGGINPADAREAADTVDGYENLEAFVLDPNGLQASLSHLHFRPQHEFVCASGGDLAVDHLIRYESLHDDYERVRRRVRGRSLFHLNGTHGSSADDARALSPLARWTIAEAYDADYRLLGYDLPI